MKAKLLVWVNTQDTRCQRLHKQVTVFSDDVETVTKQTMLADEGRDKVDPTMMTCVE